MIAAAAADRSSSPPTSPATPDGGAPREPALPFAQVLGQCSESGSAQGAKQSAENPRQIVKGACPPQPMGGLRQAKDKRTEETAASAVAIENFTLPFLAVVQPVVPAQVPEAVAGASDGEEEKKAAVSGIGMEGGFATDPRTTMGNSPQIASALPANTAAGDVDPAAPPIDSGRKPNVPPAPEKAAEDPGPAKRIVSAQPPASPFVSQADTRAANEGLSASPITSPPEDGSTDSAPATADAIPQPKHVPDGRASSFAGAAQAVAAPIPVESVSTGTTESSPNPGAGTAPERVVRAASPSGKAPVTRSGAAAHSSARPGHASSARPRHNEPPARTSGITVSEPAAQSSSATESDPGAPADGSPMEVLAASPPGTSLGAPLQEPETLAARVSAAPVPHQPVTAEVPAPARDPNPSVNPAPGPADAPPLSVGVHGARVLERMGQSEMHVGVRTADFGNVEVHTSLNRNHVDAVIATTHPELRSAMQAELVSLQRAMDRHQLQLDHFDLGSMNHGGQSDGSADHYARPSVRGGPSVRDAVPSETANSPPESTARWGTHSSRISVIA